MELRNFKNENSTEYTIATEMYIAFVPFIYIIVIFLCIRLHSKLNIGTTNQHQIFIIKVQFLRE